MAWSGSYVMVEAVIDSDEDDAPASPSRQARSTPLVPEPPSVIDPPEALTSGAQWGVDSADCRVGRGVGDDVVYLLGPSGKVVLPSWSSSITISGSSERGGVRLARWVKAGDGACVGLAQVCQCARARVVQDMCARARRTSGG